jgi:hypothetical protein
MQRVGAMALGILLLVQPAGAASGRRVIALPNSVDTVIIPESSTLHFRSLTTDNTVKFDGPIEVSGTYYYGENVYDDGSPTAAPMLYFVLDKASLARLPRFGTRGQPGELYFTNENDLTKAIVPPADAKAAAHKGAKYASGKADIWVDHFEAGIECDAPNFTAHFLSVAHPPMRVALAAQPDVGC